jgi:large subunit ribosomal protein L13
MTTIIDANGATLGRLSTDTAKRLLGGEEIAIVNSENAIISGKKSSIKNRYKQKREVGTYRKGPFFPRMPDMIVKKFEIIEEAKKQPIEYITIKELSKSLGVQF